MSSLRTDLVCLFVMFFAVAMVSAAPRAPTVDDLVQKMSKLGDMYIDKFVKDGKLREIINKIIKDEGKTANKELKEDKILHKKAIDLAVDEFDTESERRDFKEFAKDHADLQKFTVEELDKVFNNVVEHIKVKVNSDIDKEVDKIIAENEQKTKH
ncbi:hypothetical protein WDU94_010626 [Cyamophila willieti]